VSVCVCACVCVQQLYEQSLNTHTRSLSLSRSLSIYLSLSLEHTHTGPYSSYYHLLPHLPRLFPPVRGRFLMPVFVLPREAGWGDGSGTYQAFFFLLRPTAVKPRGTLVRWGLNSYSCYEDLKDTCASRTRALRATTVIRPYDTLLL
jgi:hypothetical protein